MKSYNSSLQLHGMITKMGNKHKISAVWVRCRTAQGSRGWTIRDKSRGRAAAVSMGRAPRGDSCQLSVQQRDLDSQREDSFERALPRCFWFFTRFSQCFLEAVSKIRILYFRRDGTSEQPPGVLDRWHQRKTSLGGGLCMWPRGLGWGWGAPSWVNGAATQHIVRGERQQPG